MKGESTVKTILNKLDKMDYWTEFHKYPRISGSYSKPDSLPTSGTFSSTDRKSKCWKYATTYNHTASKKTIQHATCGNSSSIHYGLEISGFRVGLFSELESNRTQTTITNFIETDDLGYLKRWNNPTSVTIYAYSQNGVPSICYELPQAEISRKWLGKLEITHHTKRIIHL